MDKYSKVEMMPNIDILLAAMTYNNNTKESRDLELL